MRESYKKLIGWQDIFSTAEILPRNGPAIPIAFRVLLQLIISSVLYNLLVSFPRSR